MLDTKRRKKSDCIGTRSMFGGIKIRTGLYLVINADLNVKIAEVSGFLKVLENLSSRV